jgi:UDP-N-acetylmuramoyl-L-alanyl-D-glutamate--2,6-diaminopimelate ligase
LRLIDLLAEEPLATMPETALRNSEIVGLTCDSRKVEPGFLFAALPGTHADGRAFIPEALARGARVILAPPGIALDSPGCSIAVVNVENPRRQYALMAARFFGRQPRTIAAVTGTNGKTSTVAFLRQIWTHLGRRAASLGTLGIVAPGFEVPGSLTTPDPADLHKSLKQLADSGIDCLAIEASSHGLAQYRLDGVALAAAAFTNLTRDHLDYHGTIEAYLKAKLRLFTEVLPSTGAAAINGGVPYAEAVETACRQRGQRVIAYGPRGRDIRLVKVTPKSDGQHLTLIVMGRETAIDLPLAGAFQAENALAALALAIACGAGAEEATGALVKLTGVPGRLQLVGRHPNGAPVFVDYAHTPDALMTVLKALRPHAAGHLLVVFGCGGDRDPGKRPEMGRIADQLANTVIVTDDNPRREDPADIRRQVLAGTSAAHEIADRGQAIRAAVRALNKGDVLVVAGKGHERGQIVGNEVRLFDDAEVVRDALKEAAP